MPDAVNRGLPIMQNLSGGNGMSRRSRVAWIVALSLAVIGMMRGSTYLLGSILKVPWEVGMPLVPVVASLLSLVPLLLFPGIRDVGSLRLYRTWTVWLLAPILALNWAYSMFILFPGALPPHFFFLRIGGGAAVGVFEEMMFRGYAFRRDPGSHPRFVILVTSFCFAAVHLTGLFERPAATVLPQVGFSLVVGLCLGIIRLLSGSLGWCIILHAAINAATPASFPAFDAWRGWVLSATGAAAVMVLWCHPGMRWRPGVLT